MRLLISISLALSACAGAGEACDTEDATRCLSNVAEECSGGEWTVLDDCEANGQECHQDDMMEDGVAHCM